ncbi:thioredoxin family protein [Halobaculum gomorrense]|uniref:Thioredoxin 1 n=1 Tax=Halobaculum gomorrense TaxID=43928 RepID=A0A1M5P0Q6_9EURY|nr:thioredoxin family protein [Halobaculum gomorrense]SHG95414.1 thioredoxin 1 [Halobaculum gomorrense]
MAIKIAETGSVISLGDDDDIESVVEDTGVTLVEFFTEWCGTCQRMKPMLETITADTDTAVAMIDIESHLETAIEFGAQSAPTFVLFADGQPVKQLRGGQTEQSLRELIATYSD